MANVDPAQARLDERFKKKGLRLAALQELIHDAHEVKIGTLEDVAVAFAKSNARHAAFLRFSESSYAKLHEDRFAARALDDGACAQARAWLGRFLEWMLDSEHEDEVVSTAAARKAFEKGFAKKRAEALLHTLGDYPRACFLLDMREAERKVGERMGFDISRADGHSIAFRLDRETKTIVVLEPNFGEYRFTLTDRPQLHDFLAAVWDFYAVNRLLLSIGTLSMIGMPPDEEEDDEDE